MKVVNETFRVDPAKVAKQAKEAGEFMIMKCNSGNLLLTGQFVISLSEEQFWSVRCKLEIPKLEQWYLQTKKDGLYKSERKPDLAEWEQRYNDWINYADQEKELINTFIDLQGYSLYTDGLSYIALKQERLGMLQYSEEMLRSGNMIVIDGVHVIAPMPDSVWQKNAWLRILPGMNIENEAEDEK